MQIDQEKIGAFLAELRGQMTQGDLAKKLGTSREAISKWERGVSLPSPDMLLKISKYFKVSIDEIYKGEKITNNKSPVNISLYILIIISVILVAFVGCFMAYQNNKSNEEEKEFTPVNIVRTYRVCSIEDSNDNKYLFVTIRGFQQEEVQTIRVKKDLANLTVGKWYEFEFKLNKEIDFSLISLENNIGDILMLYQNSDIISITPTDKMGLEQRNDTIDLNK